MKRALITGALVAALSLLASRVTHGFRLHHIYYPMEERAESAISPKWFAEPFFYLTKGAQSYVFCNKEKTLVLKLFRCNEWTQEVRHNVITSCQYANDMLRNETALLGTHFCRSSNLGNVTIYDSNHIAHTISLDDIPFVIQKYATPVGAHLLALRKTGQIESAKACIDALIANLCHRFSLLISDKDPHPIRNFGVLEGRVIDLDVGGFVRDPKKDHNYLYHQELAEVGEKFAPWLKKHFPEIVSYAKMRIEEVMCEDKRSDLGGTKPISPSP